MRLPAEPLQFAATNPAPAHVVLPLMLLLPVGGAGLGAAGVGNDTACGNCTIPFVTVALPFWVSASTAPLLQVPTPVRGVDRDPLTTELPDSVRLPLVPTLPPEATVTGLPLAKVMTLES